MLVVAFVSWLVGRLVGWLENKCVVLVSWLVGWLVGVLVAGKFVSWLGGLPVGWLVRLLVGEVCNQEDS